jgi:hypothetical protein
MAKSPTRSNREIRKPKAQRPPPEAATSSRNVAPDAATASLARKPKGRA